MSEDRWDIAQILAAVIFVPLLIGALALAVALMMRGIYWLLNFVLG